jgi:hypothetical protein
MKDVFQPIPSAVETLWGSFLKSPVSVSVGASQDYKTAHFVDFTFYENLYDKITEETVNTTTSGDKYFFLPGASYSQARIKELCKQSKIVITNNIEDANVIVSNKDCFVSVRYSPEDIKSYHIGYEDVFALVDSGNGIKQLRKKTSWREDTVEPSYRSIVTPLMLIAAYHIENTGKCVMSFDTFVKNSSSQVIVPITEEMVETISQMIYSGNTDDKKLAANLLVNIDTRKNKHFLWRLFKKTSPYLPSIDNKNKDFKQWIESSDYNKINDIKAEYMIKILEKEKTLTYDEFVYLEKFARQEVQIYHRSMYSFEVKLIPEWRELLETLKKEKDESYVQNLQNNTI